MEWQVEDARLSELVHCAKREGPQTVMAGDQRVAVVLAADAYDALAAERPSLVDHLLAGRAGPTTWSKLLTTASKRRVARRCPDRNDYRNYRTAASDRSAPLVSR